MIRYGAGASIRTQTSASTALLVYSMTIFNIRNQTYEGTNATVATVAQVRLAHPLM